MSVSFENSHQCVGLNRVGAYMQPSRDKAYPNHLPQGEGENNAVHGDRSVPATNEKWRRWTGMVGADEHRLTWKQRKRGIRRLLRQIEKRVCQIGSVGATRPAVGTRASAGRTSRAERLCASEWSGELGNWARSKRCGRTLESICVEFGISPSRLSALTREYNSMSAQDVIDGYRIPGLRKILVGQLREAAFQLWGPPGEFAQRRCMVRGSVSYVDECVPHHEAQRSGVPDEPRRARHTTTLRSVVWHTKRGDLANSRHGLLNSSAPKRSKYFRTQPWEFFGIHPGDEERTRVSELLGKLDALRGENDWRVDNLAIQLGFENAAALKRACLNVMGRTVEQIERIMAREIVEYYLAAEDRELRRIAMMKVGGALSPAGRQECLSHDAGAKSPGHCICAAREIYCGDAEIVPEEPFLDRWSACEFARREWLNAMRKEFG